MTREVKEASIPLYIAVKQHMLKSIKDQTWTSGMKLPSESELCQMYDVSRITVRQALAELQNEGVVTKYRGKGTFVEPSKVTIGLMNLIGYTEQLTQRGIRVTQRIMEVKVMPAEKGIAEALSIQADDPIIFVHRLRFADGEPFMLSRTWLPWKLAPHMVDEMKAGKVLSIFNYLREERGIQMVRAHDTLEPVILTKHESRQLQCVEGAPALKIESITLDINHAPVEMTHSTIRGDRCKYFIEYVR